MMAAEKRRVIVTAQHGLNLRAEPARSAKIIAVLPEGKRVTVCDEVQPPEGWLCVRCGKKQGYAMTLYLAEV